MNSTALDLTTTAELVDQTYDNELTSEELARFQLDLWGLLSKRSALYTSGESSSLPEETAHRMLGSILFTLNLDAESLDPCQVRTLLEEGLESRFLKELVSLEAIENSFMQKFNLAQSESLLRAVHPEYKVLIINLFEPIAINAVGKVLVGESPLDLSMSTSDCAKIYALAADCSNRQLQGRLTYAVRKMCADLKASDSAERYLEAMIPDLVARIRSACDNKTLEGVFLKI